METKKILDYKKICFIICSNNDMYLEECLFYIDNLHVPKGYTVDVISIQEGKSMASAYNEAMNASDAGYKIYLHHDVFILYKDFLQAIISIFEKDKQIGMIGMVGATKMPLNGIMWYSDRAGDLYHAGNSPGEWKNYKYSLSQGDHTVEVVDGLLMATAYDIPWREDLFDGWDYYDVSQSLEFYRAGYKVVVPEQKVPWCYHDSKIMNLKYYDHYRKIGMEEYKEIFDRERFTIYTGRDKSENQKSIQEDYPYILIISHNQYKELRETLKSLADRAKYPKEKIIIADNGSEDELRHFLRWQKEYPYIICNEIMEGYGTVISRVVEAFDLQASSQGLLLLIPGMTITNKTMANLCNHILFDSCHDRKQNSHPPYENQKNLPGNEINIPYLKGDYIDKESNNSHYDGNLSDKIIENEPNSGRTCGIVTARINDNRDVNSNALTARRVMGMRYEAALLTSQLLQNLDMKKIEGLMLPDNVERYISFEAIKNNYNAYEVEKTLFHYNSNIAMADAYKQRFKDNNDKDLLKEYLGLNYHNLTPNYSLIEMMAPSCDPLNILEIGCDCGANLLEIHNKYPQANLYGIEINPVSARIAGHIDVFQRIAVGNIEDKKVDFGNVKFDYIIFGDVLEHLRDPEATIIYCKELLKENGKLLACIPNLMHYSVMRQLIDGNFTYTDAGLLDRTHIHLFTYNEIIKMFTHAGYDIDKLSYTGGTEAVSSEVKMFVDTLLKLSDKTEEFMYYVFQYIVLATKTGNPE